MSLNTRQKKVLKLLIEHHIQHAEPVGSKTLVDGYGLKVSSATIRNDLSLLEKLGFVRQPHTSAGRVPTEKAYVFYLKNFVKAKRGNQIKTEICQAVDQNADAETKVKCLAKTIVDLTGETVVIAFDPRWSYYTGVSNLFKKPEFTDVQTVSGLVDQFDEVVHGLFAIALDQPEVLIGSDNPFGAQMSAIVVRYRLPSSQEGLIGIVGPLRMDYSRNLGILESALEILTNKAYE